MQDQFGILGVIKDIPVDKCAWIWIALKWTATTFQFTKEIFKVAMGNQSQMMYIY